MKTLMGIFRSPADAEAALEELRANTFSQDQFILLTPQTLATEPLTEQGPAPEPPGACGANAGQVGGAITGFASGILGGALIGLAIPGLGPILTVGALALGGGLGAVAGGVVGNTVQENTSSLVSPEERFIYEYALRQGAQVLIIQPTDERREEMARSILATHGAEDATQARERWWQQLRTNEANQYSNSDKSFSTIEVRYRQGFEAALDARLRGMASEEKDAFLAQHYATVSQDEVFRQGFSRGESYYKALVERGDPRRSADFSAIEDSSA